MPQRSTPPGPTTTVLFKRVAAWRGPVRTSKDVVSLQLHKQARSNNRPAGVSSWCLTHTGPSTGSRRPGRLMAYSLSSGGSDWRNIKVMTIDPLTGEGRDLKDSLEFVKFSSMAWSHDNKGFFYNRYDKPQEGNGDLGTETDINLNQLLCYHIIGTPQSEDPVVYAVPDQPEWMLGAEVTDDGRYLLISVTSGCEPTNRLWYIDLQQIPQGTSGALDFSPFHFGKPGQQQLPLVKLVDHFDAQYEYVANQGSVFTIKTNLKAPRYRLVRTDLADPGKPENWGDVIPQHNKDLLQWAAALQGDVLVTCYLKDVVSSLQLRSLASGAVTKEVPLSGIGSVASFSGLRKDTEFFFLFTGFTEPGAIYRVDVSGDAPEPVLYRRIQLKHAFNPDDFVTEQVFATSKDGTQIPMFVVHKKGIKMDGSNPTLLYGYGGFNISLEPGFSVSRLCYILGYGGGIYAVANLRGGGEYGVEWRAAGSLHNKQNVFDDFQACAEHLISRGYTSPPKLTIQGGSNGGLLVAATVNQRPDLFGAAIAQVGVMDMLRFHKFTIGHAWMTDYGNPDKQEDLQYILSYSPLHNVRTPRGGSRQYPAMILTTGDHDDRVVPLHSHKLTATLQFVAQSKGSLQRNPLITRIDKKAGHGAGKPTEKIIAEVADYYSFAAKVCGASWVGQ